MAQPDTAEGARWTALVDRLEKVPQDPSPRSHPRNWAFRTKRALDFVGHSRPQYARFWRKANPYPRPFRHLTFRTEDGVQIAAWYGPPQEGPKPTFGIVVVPGIFSSKDDTVHKSRAIRIWRHWKVPVLALDMRAFGESTGIATGGWKEALDVHAGAKKLAELSGVGRIGVIAESMGGAAALNALAHDSRSGTDLITGGVLAWSAFVDTRDAVSYISTEPARDHPFRRAWGAFGRLLLFRSMGGYQNFAEYMEDAAHVNGLESLSELYDMANPKWKVPMMHHPTLMVHALDDPVVPVRHARRMERYARDQPHIQVLVTTWGQHTGFEAMDPWWYWEVTRRFFGEVNDVPLGNLSRQEERGAKKALRHVRP